MDDIVARPAESLYEQDFYAWTQLQADLLRKGQVDRADIANILEEIETLGRKEAAELRSSLKVLAQQLLKEIYQPERASRSWAATIDKQRDEIVLPLQDNPSLRAKAFETFGKVYAGSRRVAAADTGLPLARFPVDTPFSYAQAIDDAFWPGRAQDDRD